MNGFTMPPLPRTDYGMRQERAWYDELSGPSVDNRENAWLAKLGKEIPRVPWDDFTREWLDWRVGEHFALIGPTGQGKTTMLHNLLPFHPFVAVFATKPRDSSMDKLLEEGYVRVDRWRSLNPEQFPRRVLWPDASTINAIENQKVVFQDAFNRIYREGGWTVAVDELWYIINVLGLSREIRVFLLQARALGISLVCATQRPAFVPLEVYDQSTHLMFWRDNDETNLKRISGFASNQAGLVRQTVRSLERFQVLYMNTRTGVMLRTRCPAVD